jgi:hypothetical protein
MRSYHIDELSHDSICINELRKELGKQDVDVNGSNQSFSRLEDTKQQRAD